MSTQHVVIPHGDPRAEPGRWCSEPRKAGPPRVFLSCPRCGNVCCLTPLRDAWTVLPDGRVTPSVHCLCPARPDGTKMEGGQCGWHEFVRLEGWPPS